MTLNPTTVLQLAHERRRDLARLAPPAAAALPRRPRRFRRTLRRAVSAPITRTT